MDDQAAGTASDVAEREAAVRESVFWRLVPESVPQAYAPVTEELMERVLHGLRRVAE